MAKIGRPEKPIDWKLFEQLCHIQCTQSEIASFFNVSVDTLIDRTLKQYEDPFSTVYKKYSEGGKCSLRRTQWKMAEKSCAMAIFLGKNLLGQRDSFIEVTAVAPNQQELDKDHKIMLLEAAIAKLKREKTDDKLKAEPELRRGVA